MVRQEKIAKLNDNNYPSWKTAVKCALIQNKMQSCIVVDSNGAPTYKPGEDAAAIALEMEARTVIVQNLEPVVQRYVDLENDHAAVIWAKLEHVFASKAASRVVELKARFNRIGMRNGESVFD
jgi:hypothetical protein